MYAVFLVHLDIWNHVLIIVPVNILIICGYIPVGVSGLLCFGEHMTRKKKTGNARSSANRKRCRQGGHMTGVAHSGKQPDERQLTIRHQRKLFGNKEIPEEVKFTEPSVTPPFYSVARKCWVVQFNAYENITIGKQSWVRSVAESIECKTKEEAIEAWNYVHHVQSSGEFREIRFSMSAKQQRDNLVKFPA